MGDEIYYRGGVGDEITIDPASLNLDALPYSLLYAGWSVIIKYPQEESGEIGISLYDVGGSGGRTCAEVAHSLNLVDTESGEMLPGYEVSGEAGSLQVRYKGVADIRFAEFVKALFGLSPS